MEIDQPLVSGRASPDRTEPEEPDFEEPLFEIIESTFCEWNTDSEFIIFSSGKRFIIRLFEDRFSDAPHLKERYLFFLRVALDGGEVDGHTIEDFEDWVMEPFLPMLQSLNQSHPNLLPKKTLDGFLFAETLTFIVGAEEGQLSAIPCETTQSDRDYVGFGIHLPDNLCSSWPCYQPSEIEIWDDNPAKQLSWLYKKVLPLGTTTPLFLKFLNHGDTRLTERELRTYKRIDDMLPGPEVRLRRLHGVVRDDDGTVFGLLLTYIHTAGSTLTCALGAEDITADSRRKWKSQISSTVDLLHNVGIIWGGARTDNVLIDDQDDAWVINFGGGYTEGLVDTECSGTLAGDAQGLANILRLIDEHQPGAGGALQGPSSAGSPAVPL